MSRPPSSRPLRLSAPAAWLLVAALLLAQALGLAHRVHHGSGQAARSAAALPSVQASVSKSLFGHLAGDTACPLYDHAASGDAGVWQPAALPVLEVGATPLLAPVQGCAPAAGRAYDARAPPRA
ncbi:hypothetical protein [Eleftheria terrae]|uniref:hypothetical protein n=1 Tax=Eleftheria terrae TaxID=1597781 RepID=UPI00263AA862|nr:hypothetical protein [Eleftheria terrae]WKB52430.1 hypothetical protein N7L95_21960 [Eleftheria terrae]